MFVDELCICIFGVCLVIVDRFVNFAIPDVLKSFLVWCTCVKKVMNVSDSIRDPLVRDVARCVQCSGEILLKCGILFFDIIFSCRFSASLFWDVRLMLKGFCSPSFSINKMFLLCCGFRTSL